MARGARYDTLYKGCYAHIISRSIRKLKLFKDYEDFKFFKDLLLQAKRKGAFKVFHYCIMQTHFHLAVKMEDIEAFSYCMRDIKRSYVYKFHAKYKLSGPVWRERFRSLLIENETYVYACGKYIENNPVKAGLVDQRTDWEYSSSRHYENNFVDVLVDDYEKTFKEVDGLILDRDEFESGSVIGSKFFRFQFLEDRKFGRRVP